MNKKTAKMKVRHFHILGGRYDGLSLTIPCPGGMPPDGTPVSFETRALEDSSGNVGTRLPRYAFFVKDGHYLSPCGFADEMDMNFPDPSKN